ncbi:hypothetical protein LCGC14_1305060 [marine sediment metagenome]|uniref:Uncharacterized protein n=1 Tax=marine sediment metagenome TaxID=412755 RepID=A0A0F9KPL6_9ZZZZ
MPKQTHWTIVDFDCWHGCNNPEFNPGCDESSIRIKINEEMDDKFRLFDKYMEVPCPRCGKVGVQKRSGWWGGITEDTELKEPDPSKGTFLLSEVQDYTNQMIKAKRVELKHEVKSKKQRVTKMEKRIKDLK